MAEIKISQLPAITDITEDASIPLVQGGSTQRITFGNFLQNVRTDALSSYTLNANLTSTLAQYTLSSTLTNYTTNANLTSTLASYTLNANLTSTLASYQLTTSTLTLTNLTANTITVTGTGVYMPNRPAFRVIGNGGAISATTTVTNAHWVLDYQQGTALNTSTGIFTAPVTGLYQVNVVVRTFSNTNTSINQIIIYKDSGTSTTAQIMVEFGNNTSMNHAGGSTISRLDVGDQLRFIVAVGTISFDSNDNWSVAYIG